MDSNYDFLGDLPDDDSAFESSSLNSPLAPTRPGSGQELGEYGLGGFDDASSVVVDTEFKPMTPTEASFDPRLAFEVALNPDLINDIYPRYGHSLDSWMMLAGSPAFKHAVLKHQNEILESGISFRMKAKVQAESYLKDAHLLIKHPMTPPTVKADMIKWTTKVADLEPRKEAADQGTTFNLQINLDI